MNDEVKTIENTIFEKKSIMKQVEAMMEQVKESESDYIKVKFETKHWYGFTEPFLTKNKHKFTIEKEIMLKLLQDMLDREQDEINKCIDLEIELRLKRNKLKNI